MQHVIQNGAAAGRMSQQMNSVQVERIAHGVQLLAAQRQRIDGTVLGNLGVAAADLIVKDYAAPVVNQRRQRFEVVVRESRTTMHHQQWQVTGLAISVLGIPEPMSLNKTLSLLRWLASQDEVIGHRFSFPSKCHNRTTSLSYVKVYVGDLVLLRQVFCFGEVWLEMVMKKISNSCCERMEQATTFKQSLCFVNNPC